MASSSPSDAKPPGGTGEPQGTTTPGVPAVSAGGPELQICAGVGWVTFEHHGHSDNGGSSASASAATDLSTRVPLLRCMGARFSQQFVATTSSRRVNAPSPVVASASRAASSGSGIGQSQSTSGFAEVSGETWGLLCAGQLSMIVPPATSSKSGAELANISAWAPCRFRCAGVSLRLDAVVAADERSDQASNSSTRDERSSDDQQEEAMTPLEFAEDLGRAGFRGIEAVTGRARHILVTAGGAAREAGPRRFAANTAETSAKICKQAVKIAMRSVEQVRRLASAPWRVGSGGESS